MPQRLPESLLNSITKSLAFKADGKPVLAVIPGDSKVDESKLAKVLGVKRVESASLEEAEKFSCYPSGGTRLSITPG